MSSLSLSTTLLYQTLSSGSARPPLETLGSGALSTRDARVPRVWADLWPGPPINTTQEEVSGCIEAHIRGELTSLAAIVPGREDKGKGVYILRVFDVFTSRDCPSGIARARDTRARRSLYRLFQQCTCYIKGLYTALSSPTSFVHRKNRYWLRHAQQFNTEYTTVSITTVCPQVVA